LLSSRPGGGGLARIAGAMFSFIHSLSSFDEGSISHLEQRLRAADSIRLPVTLRGSADPSDWVILSGWKAGYGMVRHTFPALLVLDPTMRPGLDRIIDNFLLCWP
jgi:hypothetical protein